MSVIDRPQSQVQPSTVTPEVAPVPPLENGDHLTRAEFHRRYLAMPGVRAELIEGVVYMSSPVSVRNHGEQTAAMTGSLFVYASTTLGTRLADNSTVIIDLDNEYQPDVHLRLDEKVGGQSKLVGEYLKGVPELIVEVANSSANIDLYDKLNVYRRAGVKEYLVWLVRETRFACFRATNETLAPVDLADGLFKSEIFPGLVLNTIALITGDLAAALATLQAGIASPEHAAFVAALQSRQSV